MADTGETAPSASSSTTGTTATTRRTGAPRWPRRPTRERVPEWRGVRSAARLHLGLGAARTPDGSAQADAARAHRPGAPALHPPDPLGDADLLELGRAVGVPRVAAAPETEPGRAAELQAAVVTVA